MAISIVYAILIFALLIFVHELGHFMTAKLFKVHVVEFAFGLGPQIFKKQIGETVYAVRALPFGGMCAMEGEDDENESPRSFGAAKKWKQVIILLAGAAMNFIVGFIILLCIYAPAKRVVVPEIDTFMEKFTGGGEYGLQEGDKLLEIDGYNIYSPADISEGLSRSENAPYYKIKLERGGKRMTLENVHIEPQEYTIDGKTEKYYGFYFKVKDVNFAGRLKLAWFGSLNVVRLVYMGLYDLVTGTVSVKEMAGPVGITAVMSETAKQSMMDFWYMVALIAINLAVMNLLPIPALDGGRIAFILFEAVTRIKPNRKIEGIVNAVMLLLLLGFMVYVTINDIWRLVT